MKKLVLSALVTISTLPAIAGPFGINEGDSLNAILKIGNFKESTVSHAYNATSINAGHPKIDNYTVLYTSETGVCKIIATTKIITTAYDGTEIMYEYNKWVDAISNKYGNPSAEYNFLKARAIWKEPNDFTMSVIVKDRSIASYWYNAKMNNALPDQLGGISITPILLSPSRGSIRVTYEFNNFSRCAEIFKKEDNKNL